MNGTGLQFQPLHTPFLKKLLRAALPNYISQVDRLNRDARIAAWIRANRSVPILKSRFDLYDYIDARVLDHDAPIDYFEFGVYRGESIAYWSKLNSHPQSRFFGFDSFEGLPTNWTPSITAGHFSTDGEPPETADPRVTFVKGWFQDTLHTFLSTFTRRSRLVIHHDSDIYPSVLYCLTKMDDVLVPGSILLFDEFSDPLHEFRAFEDYCAAYRRNPKALAVTSAYVEQAAFIVE
jgi:O-methyltransferase